jgi:hypothetical protein
MSWHVSIFIFEMSCIFSSGHSVVTSTKIKLNLEIESFFKGNQSIYYLFIILF